MSRVMCTSSANQSREGGWQSGDGVDDSCSTSATATFAMMTSSPVKYKWADGVVQFIQSSFAILAAYILAILDFVLKISPCQFFRETWKFVWATMTIEVITTVKEEEFETMVPTTGGFCGMGLPILRLNSVTMEEYLRDSTEDSGLGHEQDGCSSASDFLPSSNYNSSDAETDNGVHIFTGDEEAEGNNKDEDDFVPMQNSNNLPQDTQFPRRDSDTSDDGISDEQKSEETTQRLIGQVEDMFSDEHLAKDGFLLKHVRRRSDGFVSLKLVAGLRKVKQISRDFPTVLAALRLSLKLDVNLDGTKVRRMEPLTPYLKSLPISGGNKEVGANANVNKVRPSAELTQDELLNRVNMRNCINNNQCLNNGQHKKIQRNNSNASTCSSNASSRHGSFSKQYHPGTSPADLFFRNVQALYGDDSTQVNRRRGGSLPIPTNGNGNVGLNSGAPFPAYYHYQRNSTYLSPNSSPPSGSEFPQRPKSNSYCEGSPNKNSPSANGNVGMSVWLQRRMASTRSSEGTIVLTGVIRQPRGPDGSKGFANGYRQLILHEKEESSSQQSAVSA